METIMVSACAKLNLVLDVTGRRADGYHELCTVMQTIGLTDLISLTRDDQNPGIRLVTDRPELPTDRRNLCYRAAEQFFRLCGTEGGIHIDLRKRIPAAAGLAGGSTDAAAVLHGMNMLYGNRFSLKELEEAALPLGADIPFCVAGGTMLCEGIGEVMTPLPPVKDLPVVVVKPGFDLSTAEIYGRLNLPEIPADGHPEAKRFAGLLKEGVPLQSAFQEDGRWGNLLERPALALHPELQAVKDALLKCGACYAAMTGSGSAVFGLFGSREEAEQCPERYRRYMEAAGIPGLPGDVFVTETVDTGHSTTMED